MGPGVRKPKRPVPGTDLVGISHHLSEEPRFARMIN
jgi:hypothetical protein